MSRSVETIARNQPSAHLPHPEVRGEAEPRRTHDRCASFEAGLRPAPQDEERRDNGRLALGLAALLIATAPALADPPQPLGLGRAAMPAELKAWDISVLPDGRGLPVGKGDAKRGEDLFIEKCAACHGEFGEGVGRWPVLAGGIGSLKADRPDKTVGSFWPAPTTLFDYIRRAMPYGNAQSLEPDELYSLTAYVLHMSDVIRDPEQELNEKTLPQLKLPNAGGFFDDDRETSERHFWRQDVCMRDCRSGPAQVTGRAMVLDVTPDSKTAPRVE